MKIEIVVYFGLLILVCSCSEISSNKPTHIIKPSLTIESINDSIFFTNVEFITTKDNVLVLDKHQAYLLKLSQDLDLISYYQSKGEGDGDMGFPVNMSTIGDRLFVEDLAYQKVNIFDINTFDYLKSFRLPAPSIAKNSYATSEGKFIYSTFPNESGAGIIQFDLGDNSLIEFGKIFENKRINQQFRSTTKDDHGNIFTIGTSVGIIDKFDKEGDFIKRFDISSYEPVRRSLDSMQMDFLKKPELQNNNVIQDLFYDAQYHKGKLYISFSDRIGLDRSKARHLLVFGFDKDENLNFDSIIKINTGTEDDHFALNSFHLDRYSNKLYAQGLITNNIYIFQLPE